MVVKKCSAKKQSFGLNMQPSPHRASPSSLHAREMAQDPRETLRRLQRSLQNARGGGGMPGGPAMGGGVFAALMLGGGVFLISNALFNGTALPFYPSFQALASNQVPQSTAVTARSSTRASAVSRKTSTPKAPISRSRGSRHPSPTTCAPSRETSLLLLARRSYRL